jgi:hypothetical protein
MSLLLLATAAGSPDFRIYGKPGRAVESAVDQRRAT